MGRRRLSRVLSRRGSRVALLAVLAALPLLAGGWLWLRHSSFVSVQHVQVSGVSGPEAAAIEAALEGAARHMSTLDVRSGALSAAVAPFRVVRAVKAVPRFPHGLRIEVSEQLPVAALVVGGIRTAVAGDGVVLGPALLSGSLPSVGGAVEPSIGARVSDWTELDALAVMGAAPGPLARLATRAYFGPEGLTVAMRNGLLAYFGDATRPHAKWFSLARVLADSSSAGASYVDVRLPSRPAAGFPAGVTPPSASSTPTPASGEATGGSTESSTVGALAAGLGASAGAGKSSNPPATSTTEAESPPAGAAGSSTGTSPPATPEEAQATPGTPASEAPASATPPGG